MSATATSLVPPASAFQPGDLVLNKYRVLAFLGQGMFGEVYHVLNETLGREAALKLVRVLNPLKHKAVVEAQAQSLCSHDNVVAIHSADAFPNAVLIEMEFLPGGSLADRLEREFVPVVDSIGYMKQVLFALEHAHDRGIVHRDVKPGNIMLDGATAKLSDFGTVIHPDSGVMVTSLFYQPHAAPEAVLAGNFTAASDVFAAGLTLLRAVNNRPDLTLILGRPDWHELLKTGGFADAIGYAEFLPLGLKRVISKAVAPKVADRYPSAAALRQALERLRPARRWIREDAQTWRCDISGREERVEYVPGRCHEIRYSVNGRRKRELCREFDNERDARKHLDRCVAKTTFA